MKSYILLCLDKSQMYFKSWDCFSFWWFALMINLIVSLAESVCLQTTQNCMPAQTLCKCPSTKQMCCHSHKHWKGGQGADPPLFGQQISGCQ